MRAGIFSVLVFVAIGAASAQEQPTKQNGATYFAILPVLDVDTRAVSSDADLINGVVEGTLRAFLQFCSRFSWNESLCRSEAHINAPGHLLSNEDVNVQKLNAIFWDPNMPRTEKVDKIIQELLTPNGIDVLISGQIHYKADRSVTWRPLIISKAAKTLATESRTLKQDDFACRDPNNPDRPMLCPRAVEDIRDVVIRLLKQL